jgi:hypothetical protein
MKASKEVIDIIRKIRNDETTWNIRSDAFYTHGYHDACDRIQEEVEFSDKLNEELSPPIGNIGEFSDKLNEELSPPIGNIGEFSDGYHTFDELYLHRCVLFSVICNQNKSNAWKSKKHYDGEMYPEMFIVGLNTPYGQCTYHYDIKCWDWFQVPELECAPKWDGHTSEDVIERLKLFSLNQKGEE